MSSIVITGSSSGIGKATAKYFAQKGWKVAATMRRPEQETELNKLANISLYALDVTDDASIARASEEILKDFSTVDAVLNNAGYGLIGPFEAASPEQIHRQFDVNVFGLMRVTRAFLPHFRKRRAGIFLNVSSMGGLVTFPIISLYHSSKWAVEGFSESLFFEMEELGVQVKIIEPGGVKTDFGTRSLVVASREDITDYDALSTKMQNAGSSFFHSATAEQIAEAIYGAATDGKKQLRYLVGEDAKQLVGLRKEKGDDGYIASITKTVQSA